MKLFLAALLFCLPGACDAPDPPSVLRLELILPRKSEGVYLNEPLDFYFSAEVDRSSVTHAMRVTDGAGRIARGTFEVERDRVRFLPAPVLASDLDDGGFRLDTAYTVEILGFPCPDGLRGVDGQPLERTYRWPFHTVARPADAGSTDGVVFGDNTPERSSPLHLLTPVIGPEESLIFLCRDEPLDPSSVFDGDFELWRIERGTPERIGLKARLVQDIGPRQVDRRAAFLLERDADGSLHIDPGRAALLELYPMKTLSPSDAETTYQLNWSAGGLRLRDHGGNAVGVLTSSSFPQLEIEVIEREGEGQSPRGVHRESFLDPALRTPFAVEGADGTAHWSNRGRVEVRYPAAAGSGEAGPVSLGDLESRRDLHATRLGLPSNTTCRLDPGPGPVVFRAQGRMVIAGNLVRDTLEPPDGPGRKFEDEPFAQGGSLTGWLERLQREGRSWTVLIAGGDLIIDGDLSADTPILLVAGGLIRVAGTVEAYERRLYLLREGGGPTLDITTRIANLELDPPRENPLREPLTFAVLSGPIPQRGGVRRWRTVSGGGSHNFGDFRVRYVDESLPPSGSALSPVEDPRLLPEGTGALRLLIELEVRPADGWGTQWNPPFVDYVHLSWDE